MAIVNLEQGSPQWHEYRSRRIMATDTPVILGNNPWVTKLQRYEEKNGLRPPVELNDAMREGIRKEPIARAIIEEMLGMKFTPIVYESDLYPWMAASLDGISDCGKYIIEIKCPTKPKLHFDNKQGIIPRYYRDQMDHQIICPPRILTNFFCTFFEEDKKERVKITKYELLDDEREAIEEEITIEGYEFYVQMCTMKPPEKWKFKEKK